MQARNYLSTNRLTCDSGSNIFERRLERGCSLLLGHLELALGQDLKAYLQHERFIKILK